MNKRELTARVIAFYLPQFHPIPENDKWWGKGFTEWSNVAKAKPLFRKHYQPHTPTDLGFYDLRVPESRFAQAKLARNHGIEGFCYWHYWFAGKRLLERPFTEVLKSGEPDFPFCLGWANDTWSGIWHGSPNKILIEQTYPGRKDYEDHFFNLLPAFKDKRYITVNDKPIFVIYKPDNIPESKRFTDYWRTLAEKSGLKGLYFIGISPENTWIPSERGFDASCLHNPGVAFQHLVNNSLGFIDKVSLTLTNKNINQLYRNFFSKPLKLEYKEYIKHALPTLSQNFDQYPCVVPNWDNTPRSNTNGVVLQNSSPELFGEHLKKAINQVSSNENEKKIIFIKSWNEWAEGNYLEPERRFGNEYLETVQKHILT